MSLMFAPAVVLLAAGAASAQVVVPRALLSAPSVVSPALAQSLLPAPSLESSLPVPSLLGTRVLGIPGPGVTPAHIEALKAVAEALGHPLIIHGSRQTGVSHHTGLTFRHDTDLDTGVIGTPESILAVDRDLWDGKVPHMSHGPMLALPSIEEAVGMGHLVVAPAPKMMPRQLGLLQKLARSWRTDEQLTKLVASPRPKGETVQFAVIGDAEPGRFWFSRRLFNRPGAFWRMLARADRERPDFILQIGDFVSRGTVSQFSSFIRRLFTSGIKTPYLTALGNHDRHRPHGITNDKVYRATFGSPDYAFDRGGRRFIIVDSSAGRITQAQLAWLAGLLNPAVPTIVFTHIPPAPLGEWTDWGAIKGAGGFKEGSEAFMKLMAENKVQRVYMGHIHGLGMLERDGVKYVLTGGGGSPLYPGPVKVKLHHWLSVEAGPNGLVETVHADDGRTFPLQ